MKKTVCSGLGRKSTFIKLFVMSTLILIMVGNIASAAPFAYITNLGNSTVSVIDIATNNVTATINAGYLPTGVAVSPDGAKLYVTNNGYSTVTVINATTYNVTAKVNVGEYLGGVAVNSQGTKVYVADTATPIFNNSTVTIIGAVSVIDTATNNVTDTILVGNGPEGVAVTPDGKKVYVTNSDSDNVSVIDTATNNVTATIPVGNGSEGLGNGPQRAAITPDGEKVYVTNRGSDTVYIIDIATNSVVDTVPVESGPCGIAVNPTGTKVYVANSNSNTVSIIDTATNSVVDTVPVESGPCGIAVNPTGTKVYVTNYGSDTVSIIDTATNSVVDTVPVGIGPYGIAIGQFIDSVPIKSNYPIANFSSNLTSGCAPLPVQFTYHSTNATEWNWDFGDGTDSIDQNPTHTYIEPGNYTVSLTVCNEARSDTKTAIIRVIGPSAYDEEVSNNTICSGSNKAVSNKNICSKSNETICKKKTCSAKKEKISKNKDNYTIGKIACNNKSQYVQKGHIYPKKECVCVIKEQNNN